MGYYTEFSQFEDTNLFLKQNKIGLLGGTFNPIHNGHIAMAKIALYEFLLGRVIFLPLGQPPHKKDEYIAPSECRLDMIKLAIENENRFSVDQMELNRNGYTYTVDTLETLTSENRDAEYYYIIGADTLFELNNWKNYKRVFYLTNFICILRPGQNDDEVKSYVEYLNNRYGYKFFIAEEKGPDISSSFIRDLASKGKLRDGLVPAKVALYLEKNLVYYKGE